MTVVERLILLPVAPWLLPGLARDASDRVAHRTGLGVAVWTAIAPLAVAATTGGEPFPSFAAYLASAFWWSLFLDLLLLPIWYPLVLIAGAVVFDVFFRPERSPSRRLFGRAVCLCPLAIVVPWIAWNVVYAGRLAANPWFGFVDAGKPEWIFDPAVARLGTVPMGLLHLVALASLALMLTSRQLRVSSA